MKALVLEAYNHVVYKDVPEPETGSNDVLVNVMACGICGSDIHGMDGSTGRRIPPLIMGHEASGVIVRVGRDVTNWQVGDRVTFDSTIFPLNDWFTLEGRYNLSEHREVIGVSPGTYKRNGAFAEFVAVPSHVLYRIPENVTFEQAALVEPIAVALHALNVALVKTGSVCVVVGAGMIGTFLIQLLRLTGIPSVIAVDINDQSLRKAEESGATDVFNAGTQDLNAKILALTRNRGADVSFEVAGREESLNLAIRLVRKGGKVVLIGNTSPTATIPVQDVVTREISILGSCAIRGEYETVLGFMQKGMINVEKQISAVAPLSEGAEWFSKLRRNDGSLGKVILVP